MIDIRVVLLLGIPSALLVSNAIDVYNNFVSKSFVLCAANSATVIFCFLALMLFFSIVKGK